MNKPLCKALLTAVVTVPLGLLDSEYFFAQNCSPFLLGMVPLAKVHYISDPNVDGDRLVVGEWNPAIGQIWWDMPGASFP